MKNEKTPWPHVYKLQKTTEKLTYYRLEVPEPKNGQFTAYFQTFHEFTGEGAEGGTYISTPTDLLNKLNFEPPVCNSEEEIIDFIKQWANKNLSDFKLIL